MYSFVFHRRKKLMQVWVNDDIISFSDGLSLKSMKYEVEGIAEGNKGQFLWKQLGCAKNIALFFYDV